MNEMWNFALANCYNLPNIISVESNFAESNSAILQVFDDISERESCSAYVVLRVYWSVKKIYADILTGTLVYSDDKTSLLEYLPKFVLDNPKVISILDLISEKIQSNSLDVYDIWIEFYTFAKKYSNDAVKTFLFLEHMHALSCVNDEERKKSLSNIFYENFLKEDQVEIIKLCLPKELYDNDMSANKRGLLYDYYYNKFSLCLEFPFNSCLYYFCATYYWFIENGDTNNSSEDFLINTIVNIETNDLKNFTFEGIYDSKS